MKKTRCLKYVKINLMLRNTDEDVQNLYMVIA